MLEALVALLVLAVGVLGLLGAQLHTLVDMQGSAYRAQALHVIDDLAERTRDNPEGFAALGRYASDWNTGASAPGDCTAQACSPAKLAAWDLADWRASASGALPMGRAQVFLSPDEEAVAAQRRQLGVMVGWRANDRSSTSDADMARPFQLQAGPVECPAGLICHLVYVQP
ncbi:type IV pilus modification protein PilV [Variovorax ginsengisoli]|uniref:Type IV pilus assembly protein PilV n=1 Tax=Variovorax ginsengisoli TaxID=363844 RepID=A0ABT9SGZ3_9BURK|nr:type IV pilus modification protein PilV [Variovorax ginsengisoli]MDP9902662.1 type IV pilus assembly protein PilV [Variovorax ginsengisoli]